MTNSKSLQSNRIIALDRTKGLCILVMLVLTFFGMFPQFGFLNKINSFLIKNSLTATDGVQVKDCCTPFFLLLIGMSYQLSFAKRAESGKTKAYLHFAKRYLVFMGLGGMMVSIENLAESKKDPTVVLTILVLAVVGLSILWLLSLIAKNKTQKVRWIFGKAITGFLLAIGLISIVLNARDLIIQLSSSGSSDEIYNDCYMYWSILHLIGFTGLLGLLFVELPIKSKSLVFVLYTAAYTVFQCIPSILEKRDILVLGGMIGTFGWLIVLLGGMILIQLYREGGKAHWKYLVGVAAVLVMAVPTALKLPFSGRGVSSNFMLGSIFVFSIIMYVFSLFDSFKPKFALLTWWGQNPLTVFAIGLVLKLLLILFAKGKDVSIFVLLVICVFAFAILAFVPYYLNKKKVSIRL